MSRPLGAQTRIVTEVGATYAHFADDDASVAGPSIRAALSRETSRLSVAGSVGGVAGVSGSGPGGGRAGGSGSAELNGAWRAARAYRPHVELEGGVSGIVGAPSAASGLTALRFVYPIGRGGGWVRGGGSVRREAQPLWGRGVDAGGWWRWQGGSLVASVLQEWTAGQLFVGPGRTGLVGIVPVRYGQADARVELEGTNASFVVAAALRRDPDAERRLEPAARASAAFWRSPTRALVLTVARELPDFVRGGDAAQWMSIGVRFGEPARDAVRAGRARATVRVETDGEGDRRMLRVRAPGAHRVEVMGDFTGWEPLELAPSGELFSAEVAISAGTHRLVVRIDGGDWAAAANTPTVDDDFGGRVGLLVIE
jgi:hypothetical protein